MWKMIEFFFWQQFIKWFIHVQNAYLNMSVNESREHIYIVLYLNSIQPSHVKQTIKQYIYFILLHYYILRCPSITRHEIM